MMYIVVYDDEGGLCFPFRWDDECEGAIGGDGDVALFADKKSAQRAIRITVANERLRRAQGKPENTDFIEYKQCIKILPAKVKEEP